MLKKILLGILITLGILFLLGFLFRKPLMEKMMEQTKKASPEQVVEYNNNGLDLEVFYCRPSKKGRTIFAEDGLVPYGQVWRTGANEATTFETASDLTIDGKTLPAGKYSLWTVPGADEWEVIFNSEMYPWGVGWGAKAAVNREKDVLAVKVPTESTGSTVEMFTISFDQGEAIRLSLAWDDTKVSVPLNN